jgi:hypothetical protein
LIGDDMRNRYRRAQGRRTDNRILATITTAKLTSEAIANVVQLDHRYVSHRITALVREGKIVMYRDLRNGDARRVLYRKHPSVELELTSSQEVTA